MDGVDNAPDPVTYEIVEGSIGRSVELPLRAAWPMTPSPPLGRVGMVTSINLDAADELGVGDVVFTLDLVPVVVARGAVPAFRPMASGVVGEDVAQLQRFLAELGFFEGDPDGVFGEATGRAVAAWHLAISPDVRPSSTVGLGEVLFLPTLPARLVPDEGLHVGAVLEPSTSPLSVLGDAPTFTVRLGQDQAGLIEPGTTVQVDSEQWLGVVEDIVTDPETGGFIATVVGDDGAPLCSPDCSALSFGGGDALWMASVAVVPEVSGPVVPAGALVSDPAGRIGVHLDDGTFRPVEVVGADGGIVVVSGVESGETIVIPDDG